MSFLPRWFSSLQLSVLPPIHPLQLGILGPWPMLLPSESSSFLTLPFPDTRPLPISHAAQNSKVNNLPSSNNKYSIFFSPQNNQKISTLLCLLGKKKKKKKKKPICWESSFRRHVLKHIVKKIELSCYEDYGDDGKEWYQHQSVKGKVLPRTHLPRWTSWWEPG